MGNPLYFQVVSHRSTRTRRAICKQEANRDSDFRRIGGPGFFLEEGAPEIAKAGADCGAQEVEYTEGRMDAASLRAALAELAQTGSEQAAGPVFQAGRESLLRRMHAQAISVSVSWHERVSDLWQRPCWVFRLFRLALAVHRARGTFQHRACVARHCRRVRTA